MFHGDGINSPPSSVHFIISIDTVASQRFALLCSISLFGFFERGESILAELGGL
jgi:hypothetical protein